LGWGLIGTGAIAETFASDLEFTETGRVAAVGSRRLDTANGFADRFGIPNRHASYEALVADPDVDVVYVATPHPLHHANALLALRAGKPVVVEKGRGLWHQAEEVARCLREGLLESPVMPLDESVSIMETMDTVLAQGAKS
jgi:hypothetical protein